MGRIRSNYVLQIHRVTSGEVVHNFITDIWFLCHVATWTSHIATWTSHVATSKLHASVTSRRGPPTSRRHFLTLSATSRRGLTRRDVKITCLCHVATWTSHVATSFFDPLCHVATWTHTSRRQNYMPLSRRDVDFPRRDFNFTPLCYVTTWIYTSRRELVQVSVTSPRGPERRDVVWSCALSRRDVDPNVATLACLLSMTPPKP